MISIYIQPLTLVRTGEREANASIFEGLHEFLIHTDLLTLRIHDANSARRGAWSPPAWGAPRRSPCEETHAAPRSLR